MLNLVIFGPPGSGKGTQSSRIASRYKLVHLSTGELFRAEVRRYTSCGRRVEKFMNRGELIPDEIVLRKVYKAAIQYIHKPGVIFDGFPRTRKQAVLLDKLLYKKNIPLNIVFSMVVDEQELIERVMGRSEDSGRKDDNQKTIRKRLDIYKKQTQPLIEYYQKQNKVVNIIGMAPVSEVTDKISSVIDHFLKNKKIITQTL